MSSFFLILTGVSFSCLFKRDARNSLGREPALSNFTFWESVCTVRSASSCDGSGNEPLNKATVRLWFFVKLWYASMAGMAILLMSSITLFFGCASNCLFVAPGSGNAFNNVFLGMKCNSLPTLSLRIFWPLDFTAGINWFSVASFVPSCFTGLKDFACNLGCWLNFNTFVSLSLAKLNNPILFATLCSWSNIFS